VAADAFGAGLLHECGQLVFAVCRPEMFDTHLRLCQRDARLLVELEQQTFGVTHAQAGAYLLSRWGFPLGVINAAARHARPVDPVASSRLSVADAVRLAHHLVEEERVSVCSPPGRRGLDDAVLDQAGVLGEVWSWRADHVVRQASIR
jgi:HD-like signal output (HDOD) protein